MHSGSRFLGKQTAEYWQRVAVKRMKERSAYFYKNKMNVIKTLYPKYEWEDLLRKARIDSEITIPRGLEYLEGEDMYNYMIDSIFNYFYAILSREKMSDTVRNILPNNDVLESISTIHNYVNHEDFIIRKGAVTAYQGQKFILPFNFEDGTLICEGKGNSEWNFSAPHGAGRIYSRTVAKKVLKAEPVQERLTKKGIHTSVLPLDELPGAYKPAKVIEEAIEPTATIIHRIKPIITFKSKK